MTERKESHRAAQEEFRRALTGEFEPVKASAKPERAPDAFEPTPCAAVAGGPGSAREGAADVTTQGAPESVAKRAVAARAERMRAQKRRRRRIAIVASALVALALAATLGFSLFGTQNPAPFEGFFDDSAQAGQAPNKTPAELQAELNRVVEDGMFNISISSVIEFPDPQGTGKAYIENVPGNPYDMTVEITLSDSGEQVYASKGIAPGNYIEDIALATQLESGMHEAVATFTAFDRQTHDEKGKAAAEVTLLIGKGGDASG